MHIHIGWPQGIYLFFWFIRTLLNFRSWHDKDFAGYLASIIAVLFDPGLLLWGGFFS